MKARQPTSLFRRLLLGFSAVILLVALAGFFYVATEAKLTQRSRTASENQAHARELLLHLVEIADKPERMRQNAQALEDVRAEMFRRLDYHSQVRVRVWQHEQLLYNSAPELPADLPLPGTPAVRDANAWVRAVERVVVSGLPLLLLQAWLIVGIGLRPLRSFARRIEQRSAQDLTPLPTGSRTSMSS